MTTRHVASAPRRSRTAPPAWGWSRAVWPAILLAALGLAAGCNGGGDPAKEEPAGDAVARAVTVRIACFNIWELGRDKLDQSSAEGLWDHPQLANRSCRLATILNIPLTMKKADINSAKAPAVSAGASTTNTPTIR